ncbi:MAG: ABC transporter permease [Acidobacteria bacterium]|nr:ABC transporter permease [Acidobacteriota bacterium]
MTRLSRIEITLAVIVAAAAGVLAIAAPRFFEPANLRDVLLANLPVAIVAVGATIVVLTGEIDISVGSTFAVCSVAAGALASAGAPLPLALATALVAGGVIGAANGALVAYARMPSIVVTLAAMVALRDGLRWVTEGAWIQDLPAGFQWFGLSQAAYPYVAFAAVAALVAGAAWGLAMTRGGRAVYATGSNPVAARLAAIDVPRVRFAVFVAAGALTALAAVVNAVRFNQIPSNTGLGLEMKVIAAVVVGGAATSGGRGSILGTMLGVVLLGISGPALTFLGASPYWERALQGVIVLAAVGADAIRSARPFARRLQGTHRELA